VASEKFLHELAVLQQPFKLEVTADAVVKLFPAVSHALSALHEEVMFPMNPPSPPA
jgi:hypothetical protein